MADGVVEAGSAGPEQARLLRILNKSPVFFSRTSHVQEGQVVEYVKSIYRSDRYKIVNRLTRLSAEFLGTERTAAELRR